MARGRLSRAEAKDRISFILEQQQRVESVQTVLRHYLFCGFVMFHWALLIAGSRDWAVLTIPYAIFLVMGYRYVRSSVSPADGFEISQMGGELRDFDSSFPGLKDEVWMLYQGLNQFIVQQSLERTAWAIVVVVPAVSLVSGGLLYWALR